MRRVDAVVDDGDQDGAARLPAGEQLTHSALGADARHTVRCFVEELPIARRFR